MRNSRRLAVIFVLAFAFASLPGTARAEFHEAQKGNPFHLAGHLLAPIGHLYGYLIVEPFHAIVNALPELFSLE